MSDKLFKMNKAGLFGLTGVGIGFINLVFFSNENLILFTLLIMSMIATLFFVFKDQDKGEVSGYNFVLGLIFILVMSLSVCLYIFQ